MSDSRFKKAVLVLTDLYAALQVVWYDVRSFCNVQYEIFIDVRAVCDDIFPI